MNTGGITCTLHERHTRYKSPTTPLFFNSLSKPTRTNNQTIIDRLGGTPLLKPPVMLNYFTCHDVITKTFPIISTDCIGKFSMLFITKRYGISPTTATFPWLWFDMTCRYSNYILPCCRLQLHWDTAMWCHWILVGRTLILMKISYFLCF